MTTYLSSSDLLVLATAFGEGTVRDPGLLEAAAARPQASAFGADAYPDLHTKAAALLESLVCNHALVDGNKRLGWVATAVFYRLNGHLLRTDTLSGHRLVIAIADGSQDLASIADHLRAWATQP